MHAIGGYGPWEIGLDDLYSPTSWWVSIRNGIGKRYFHLFVNIFNMCCFL